MITARVVTATGEDGVERQIVEFANVTREGTHRGTFSVTEKGADFTITAGGETLTGQQILDEAGVTLD